MKNIYLVFLSASILFSNNSLLAQTSPAGIGNSSDNILWLDASKLTLSDNDDVSSWTDLSGNNNHATQLTSSFQPKFKLSSLASQPSIELDGVNDYLQFTNHITAESISAFAIYESNGSATGGIFTLKNHMFYTNSRGAQAYDTPREYYQLANTSNTPSFFQFHTDAGITSGSLLQISANQSSVSSQILTRTAFLTNKNISTIGSLLNNITPLRFYNGNIAEIIFYNREINTVERRLINAYLGNKYGIENIAYLYKWSSTHKNEVFGIGSESDGAIISNQSSGVVEISNASTLGNGDYLLVGHDAAGFSTSTNVPTGFVERWSQTWRTQVTGTPGTINIKFFLGSNTFADNSDYALLINADDDFSAGSVEHTGGLSYNLGENSITFTGVSLSNGSHFVLAEKDKNPIAIANGNWENTSTWACGCIPLASLDVTIPSPFDVTINELATAKSVSISSGGSLTFADIDTLQLVEGLTIDGTFTAGTGTLLANGTSSQTFANSSGSNVLLNNLVANNSSVLALTGGWSLSNNVHVSSGTLDVTGADSLVLLSNASKTAQILQSVDGAFTGDVTVQRHISSRNANFGLVSSPINNATVAELDDDILISGIGGRSGNSLYSAGNIFYTMFGYNRNTSKKDTVVSTSFTMVNGEGYELYLASTSSTFNGATIDYIGTPNDGNIVPNVINQGFNLVGNPYQSFIGFDNLDRSNIADSYYLYDTDAGSYTLVAGGTGGTIAPGQGFWVNKSTAGDVAFNFEESDKVSSNSSTFIRKRNVSGLTVKIENATNGFSHQAMLKTQFDAENDMDVLDARYLPSPIAAAPGIYFTLNEDFDHVVKNTISLNQDYYEADLAIEIGLLGNYKLSFENLTSLGNQFSCIKIYDKIADVLIDLNQEESYSFEANEGKTNRFKLILANSNVDCDSESIETSVVSSNELQLINKSGLWFVNYDLDHKEQFNVAVFSLTGQLVKNISSTSLEGRGSMQISNLDNLKGVYLLQIKGSTNQINQTIKF